MASRRWLLFIGLAVVFFFCRLAGAQVAVPNVPPPLPAWNPTTNKAWWAENPTAAYWSQATEKLQRQLDTRYKQDGVSCFSDPDFRGWMEHLEWVRLGIDCPDEVSRAADLASFTALGQDESISHLLVEKMIAKDNRPGVLANILKLAEANMADLHEYAALGVAYALVFDQPFPSDWPHAQVAQSAVPIGDLDIVKRFAYYVQANRNKKLDLDLTQLREEDLKHLVDSEVKLSEFDYAQGTQGKISYDSFDQAFFSIQYTMSRISPENQAMDWPYSTYTLQDIEQHGGICVDQAYYASELGKGRGIPTIYFTGQGTGGGHAWFGYMAHDGHWNLDCGRYASQNYPKGYAIDPQGWEPINDSTLARLAKNGDSDPRYQPAKTALAWARLHADSPDYPQMLEDAKNQMPELAEPWEAEADCIDRSPKATLDEKKAFYQAWINQFADDADLKVEGQQRLLAAEKAADDPEAEDLQRDIILQNRSSGFDLGVQASMGEIEDKFKAQDFDGAKVAFETSVRDFKDQGGGTFFNNVIEPYVMDCLEYAQPDQAEEGLHFTEERMTIEPDSLIDIEFKRLKSEIKWAGDAFPAIDKWLGELDEGDYVQAWGEMAKKFQDHYPQSAFVQEMQRTRLPLGKCLGRTMSSPPEMGTGMTNSSGEKMEGDFVKAHYTATFDKNPAVKEWVLFVQDDDATWRALGYGVEK